MALSHVDLARRQAIGDLLRRTAARYPGKVAVVYRDGRHTYAEFNATVNRTARALQERGVEPHDRIALIAHNSYAFVVLYFALAKLGAVSVPVNFMLTAPEVAYILCHAGASGIIAEDTLAPVAMEALRLAAQEGTDAGRLRGWIDSDGRPRDPDWEAVDAWMAHPDDSEPDVAVGDDDPIQILYTSGTESRPKGAVLTSRCLIAQYVSAVVDGEMTADDVEIHALPLYHSAQLHCFFTPDVWLGATSIILPGPEPAAILATIEREHVTKLFAPPTVWIALLRSPAFDRHDLSSLRKGYYGAAIMPVEILRELAERLPNVRLWNFYGQTEMSPVATILKPADQMRKAGSAGKACLNVETLVVDDRGLPVPPGTVGEIVHRSPHAMLGYWNDPEKTAEAFQGGWFHSGDLGVVDEDGYLTVVDRKKDMIKTGGENVASREVEEVIYRHPKVAEVAVIGIPHPYWIEAVTAVVVPKAGETVEPTEILELCRQHLAGFKVPKYVALAEALPKNPSGKILKRELRTQYAELAKS
jgi:fatty-acyl-CoA synthase